MLSTRCILYIFHSFSTLKNIAIFLTHRGFDELGVHRDGRFNPIWIECYTNLSILTRPVRVVVLVESASMRFNNVVSWKIDSISWAVNTRSKGGNPVS